jgi:hypothetical protein
MTNLPKEEIGLWNFVVNEYGISFIMALIIIVGMLYPLTLR